MSGRRFRYLPLLLGAAVAVALAVFGWPRLRPKELQPGPVVAIALTDVDGDGGDDLIVLHRAGPDADHSMLVAIDPGEGASPGDAGPAEMHWVAQTVPSDTAPVTPVPLMLAHGDALIVTGRSQRLGGEAVAVHDLVSGRPRWTWSLDDGTDWNVATRVAAEAGLVLAFSVRETVNAAHLTALDLSSGRVVWETEVGHWPGQPSRLGDALFVLATNGLTHVDLETGEATEVPGVRAGALVGDAYRVVRADASGFVLGTVDADGALEVTADEHGHPVRLPPGANPQTAVAFYAGRWLIAGAGVGHDALGLAALPLTPYPPFSGPNQGWQLAFGDRFGLLVANDDWRQVMPSGSGFMLNPSRYAPALLSRELDPVHDRLKLAVLDLERGEVSWESRVLAQRPPGLWPNDLIQSSTGAPGQFLVALPLVDDPESQEPAWRAGALVRVDGGSGQVVGAWQIADPSSDWRFPSPGHTPRPWWWREPLLAGFDGHKLFVVDLEAGRVVWSTPPDLTLVDVTGRVEALLGPLP